MKFFSPANEPQRAHLDSSSFCVQGEYLNSQPEPNSAETASREQSSQTKDSAKAEAEELAEPVPIQITHGYSRDHRPDLKHAALYNEENLIALGQTPWISRVPATIAEAQQLMQTLPQEWFRVSSLNNYSIAEVCSTYAGVPQRWLVVHSESRQQSDLKQLDKQIERGKDKNLKALKELGVHPFACEADALDAANSLSKKLKYYTLTEIEVRLKPYYDKPGRPRKGDGPTGYTYHIQATLALNESAVAAQRNQAGRFVLATNLLDDKLWSNDTVLQEDKNQQSCERGFRFLKDPLFFASRVFVKLPQRVAALAMIMGLCLLVYTIGQRQLRQALAQAEATIPNQRGKQTERPTLRWVMQCFQSVHLIWVEGRKWAIKLNDVQRHILRCLGSACQKYYFLC